MNNYNPVRQLVWERMHRDFRRKTETRDGRRGSSLPGRGVYKAKSLP